MKLVLNIEEIQIHGSLLQERDLPRFQQLLERELVGALLLKENHNSFDQDLVRETPLAPVDSSPSTLARELSLKIIEGLAP